MLSFMIKCDVQKIKGKIIRIKFIGGDPGVEGAVWLK